MREGIVKAATTPIIPRVIKTSASVKAFFLLYEFDVNIINLSKIYCSHYNFI